MTIDFQGYAIGYEVIATAADAAQQQKRAEAAEAEVARLREALAFTAGQRVVSRAEVARLRDALADIAAQTDDGDPSSYRCNDPRGCLDWVHDKAQRAQDAP